MALKIYKYTASNITQDGAACNSPTYAWDILTELASLSVCPDAKTLEARDMVHMHAVELQLHLARVFLS